MSSSLSSPSLPLALLADPAPPLAPRRWGHSHLPILLWLSGQAAILGGQIASDVRTLTNFAC